MCACVRELSNTTRHAAHAHGVCFVVEWNKSLCALLCSFFAFLRTVTWSRSKDFVLSHLARSSNWHGNDRGRESVRVCTGLRCVLCVQGGCGAIKEKARNLAELEREGAEEISKKLIKSTRSDARSAPPSVPLLEKKRSRERGRGPSFSPYHITFILFARPHPRARSIRT